MELTKVEYRVRPITRYIISRYHEEDGGKGAVSETRGEYDNPDVAYDVAYALCKVEHDHLGWPIGDERIQYPKRPGQAFNELASYQRQEQAAFDPASLTPQNSTARSL